MSARDLALRDPAIESRVDALSHLLPLATVETLYVHADTELSFAERCLLELVACAPRAGLTMEDLLFLADEVPVLAVRAWVASLVRLGRLACDGEGVTARYRVVRGVAPEGVEG